MDILNVEIMLKNLLEEVQLLTIEAKVGALQKFNNEFLSSDLRRRMYEAFDGERTLPQISDDIECKLNTLQIFAQQLVDKDLVDYEYRGNARIIKKSLAKIALYYAAKELSDANV